VAALQPAKLVPARGAMQRTAETAARGLAGTRSFVSEPYAAVKRGVAPVANLKTIDRDVSDQLRPKYGHWGIFDYHLPFDVSHAYDLLQARFAVVQDGPSRSR
jgi:hypothetical protein